MYVGTAVYEVGLMIVRGLRNAGEQHGKGQ